MIQWNRVLCPHPSIASRVIGEQALILDPRTDELQRLNPVGSYIWSCISKRDSTPADIVANLVTEFDVDEQIARQDLANFLDKLEGGGLVAYKTD
jgi:hypothetical protein